MNYTTSYTSTIVYNNNLLILLLTLESNIKSQEGARTIYKGVR